MQMKSLQVLFLVRRDKSENGKKVVKWVANEVLKLWSGFYAGASLPFPVAKEAS